MGRAYERLHLVVAALNPLSHNGRKPSVSQDPTKPRKLQKIRKLLPRSGKYLLIFVQISRELNHRLYSCRDAIVY